jgi:hypothetical protein
MARSTTARRTRAANPPRRADLTVVRPDERARTVGTIGSLVAAFFFLVLFVMAGLHAVVVQTQAELDSILADIAELEEVRDEAIGRRAEADSPAGMAERATQNGLVPAPDVPILTPVPPGRLAPPSVPDPFVGGGTG